jgi:hypothetical protein
MAHTDGLPATVFNDLFNFLVPFAGYFVALWIFAKLSGFVASYVASFVKLLLYVTCAALSAVFILKLVHDQPMGLWLYECILAQVQPTRVQTVLHEAQPFYAFTRDWLQGKLARYVEL